MVRYSERQLGVLDSLGLVAWVRPAVAMHSGSAARRTVPGGSTHPSRDTHPALDASSPVVGAPPDSLERLGSWLASCPLAGFARRGERRFDTGPEEAQLLIVAEAAAGPSSLLPLEDAEATMLKAMMRAIDVAPGDYATAVVVAQGVPSDPDAPVVLQRLGTACRALVWLSRADAACEGGPDAQRTSVGDVPLFRLPHPARLLDDPLVKRQAWHVLKSLRSVLPGA